MPRCSAFRLALVLFALASLCAYSTASPNDQNDKNDKNDKKDQQSRSSDRLTPQQRLLLIRGLQSETVYVRRTLPISKTGAVIKNGQVSPSEQEIMKLAADTGIAAKPGDKAQITALSIEDDKIVLVINGGPKKKGHWYDHVQIGATGGGGPSLQQQQPTAPDPATTGNLARGCLVTLAFNGLVPSLTLDQVKQLLLPVFTFNAKSAAEALMDRMPPVVQQALKDHKVLVGMNRDLVNAAKGRPQQRLRENDESGHPYEEWVYGAPPENVEFVRFVGDEVTQVKDMTVDGQRVVRTQKEVDMKQIEAAMTSPTGVGVSGQLSGQLPPPDANAGNGDLRANQGDTTSSPNSKRPTMRRPGEAPPDEPPTGPQPPPATAPQQPKPPTPH
jgi:hypothetical protein